jgi:hypothetical protein
VVSMNGFSLIFMLMLIAFMFTLAHSSRLQVTSEWHKGDPPYYHCF